MEGARLANGKGRSSWWAPPANWTKPANHAGEAEGEPGRPGGGGVAALLGGRPAPDWPPDDEEREQKEPLVGALLVERAEASKQRKESKFQPASSEQREASREQAAPKQQESQQFLGRRKEATSGQWKEATSRPSGGPFSGGQRAAASVARLARQESLLSSGDEPEEAQEEAQRAPEGRKERAPGGAENAQLGGWRALTCCPSRCACLGSGWSGSGEKFEGGDGKKDGKEKEGGKGEEEEELEGMWARWWRCGCVWLALLLLLLYPLAIYCVPFVRVDPRVPQAAPNIPFNFHQGPLKPSTASQFRAQHLFRDQIHGAESMAVDAQGNAYLAIEGGFILYAHLNSSAPLKNHLWPAQLHQRQPKLIKIAELNPIKQVGASTSSAGQPAGSQGASIGGLNGGAPSQRGRRQRTSEQFHYQEASSAWRRECQLDEQLYGNQLYSPTANQMMAAQRAALASSSLGGWQAEAPETSPNELEFVSRVKVSRCSKPLGMRLTPDESALYVVDTLTGLYKVHLRQADRAHSSQRLVSRLIDFRANNWHQTLPVVQFDPSSQSYEPQAARSINVSLRAVDDLTLDLGAGTRGADLIYLSIASQQWPAVGFVYDHLEGKPSGLIARFDTGNQQLAILDPNQVAHVRTSGFGLQLSSSPELGAQQLDSAPEFATQQTPSSPPLMQGDHFLLNQSNQQDYVKYGVPRLDENDIFDDRPLHFPNGLELMDDKQALLIADTSNKRIVKHYIRGPRRGTSDLWAYTPNFPDNIRRGYDKRDETYWVVGCGRAARHAGGSQLLASQEEQHLSSMAPNQETVQQQQAQGSNSNHQQEWDILVSLRTWPTFRKFAIKNVYFFGWFIEMLGQYLFMSEYIRDYGYELKMGSSLCQNGCKGMMILQYNQNGDLIRSIHSPEFPNDLKYYSQANEIIDAQNQQHSLYLSSPGYKYITKLILPSESYPSLPPFSS